ncbi:MAG: hypothetical protein NXI21_11495 [Alphaproteobacteria bacterium]|nr:hypothetical protein [Alphaproteobacteria bacterium]
MIRSRRPVAGAVLALLALLLLLDIAGGATPNPYRAPPLFALGSGQAASGGHCAAVPGR